MLRKTLAISGLVFSVCVAFYALRFELAHQATVAATTELTSVSEDNWAEEDEEEELSTRRADHFPDIELTDQFGAKHQFRSELINEKISCIAMFYTQCNGSCPATIQQMIRLRKSLSEVFPPDEVQLLAITLDPEIDTPAIMKEYADIRGIKEQDGLPSWLFCTGDHDDIEDLRFALGLYDLDPIVDADRTNHAGLIIFGSDITNRWTALPAELKTEHLMEAFRRFAGTTMEQRFVQLD